MSKSEVKKIIQDYKNKLRENGLQFQAVYLFGSHAHGKSDKWSDIDVAVVLKNTKGNYWKNWSAYSRVGLAVDNRLETHIFNINDFQNISDPMVHEIRKTGVKV